VPAECDVSIRPGWFYHEQEDDKVRTPQNLIELYFSSVGRGASFLLNLPVDKRGQIHEHDVKSLIEFRKSLDHIFADDLARRATVTTNQRGRFALKRLTDGSRQTYWLSAAPDNNKVTIDFGGDKTFNVVRLREYLPLGQRIDGFAIDEWRDGNWKQFASGTSVGNCRLVRAQKITTSKIRIRITGAAAPPAISEIGVFAEP
jgi:alpha-L-fucosidase